jgi:hypothetical protein
MTIQYEEPGVPVERAVFTDMQGKPLWEEQPYQFSRMSAVGEYLVQAGQPYTVVRVAVCEGCMYVNLEAMDREVPLTGVAR